VIDLHISNRVNDNLAFGTFNLYFLRSLPDAEYQDFSIGLADTALRGLKISIKENVTKIKKNSPESRNQRAH